MVRAAFDSAGYHNQRQPVFKYLHYLKSFARPPPQIVMRVGQQPPKRPPPVAQGSITIKCKTEKEGGTKTRISDFLNGYPLLKKTRTDEDNGDGDHGASYKKRLQVVWVPVEVAELAIPPPVVIGKQARIPPPTVHVPIKLTPQILESFMIRPVHGISFHPDGKGSLELEVELTQINLEQIILRTIRAQTDCMLRRAFAQLVQSPVPTWHAFPGPPRPYFPSVRLIPFGVDITSNRKQAPASSSLVQPQASQIEVVLHGKHTVQVLLNRYSGRFDVLPVTADQKDRKLDADLIVITTNGALRNEYRAVADKLNANPGYIKNLLLYLKSDVSRALVLVIKSYTQLNLTWRCLRCY